MATEVASHKTAIADTNKHGDDAELWNKRYKVGRELGSGVSATVYSAVDRGTGRQVAIKCYEDWKGSEGHFQREVKNLKYLNDKDPMNNHVYQNIENFKHDGRHCIVLDLYQGSTIKHEIAASRKAGLSVAVIRRSLAQLLSTFKFLHDLDVIHGDLKPDNVILVGGLKGKHVRLIDFGLSYRGGNMQKNMYIQSRWYRSPEVLLGIPATTAIDIWSIGCLAAEAFLGFAPFRGYDSFDQMQRISEILCLPNERMRGDCEPATIAKLDELEASLSKKRAHKGCAPGNVTDAQAAKVFMEKLITHRKTQHGDDPAECAQMAELCSKLLAVDPKLRITAAEALQHPFLQSEVGTSSDDDAEVSVGSPTLSLDMSLDSSSGLSDACTASPQRVAGFGSRAASPTRSPPRLPRGVASAAPAAPATTAPDKAKEAVAHAKAGFHFRPAEQMRKIIGRYRPAAKECSR